MATMMFNCPFSVGFLPPNFSSLPKGPGGISPLPGWTFEAFHHIKARELVATKLLTNKPVESEH